VSDEQRSAYEHEDMPDWVPAAIRYGARRVMFAVVLGALIFVAVTGVFSKLGGFTTSLLLALFLSFALEPAVGYLSNRFGWRRGTSTGVMFLTVVGGFVFIVALIVPAVVSGFQQLVENAPELIDRLARWLLRIGIEIDTDAAVEGIKDNADSVGQYAASLVGGVLGIASSLLGAVFQWATIGLFTFYIVAEGPRLRRAICAALPPDRQERVLFVWEQAISQTGGYFYSRLLLAIINGAGMYITLRIVEVPFAAPLAVFEGVVAAFIPIVGTYIGGAVPVIVALLTSTTAGIASLAYILIYQQIENYLLSPRLTAKTMSLHPAVAFGAAILGGALGGLLMAFLALPAAGVIQAAVKEYGRRYDVVRDELTKDHEPVDRPEGPSLFARMRRQFSDDESDPPPSQG
jgi:predicted PurR-regulated permease PerM